MRADKNSAEDLADDLAYSYPPCDSPSEIGCKYEQTQLKYL